MPEFDVRHIVPSTRDLLRVLSTRRDNLALIGEIRSEQPAAEAKRLDDVNISALAFGAAADAMLDGAGAIKNVPVLCLSPVTSREDCQRARFYGADGVCIDISMPADEWDALAKVARAMRMLAVALVRTKEQVDEALKAGARALLLRAGSVEEAIAMAGKASRNQTLVVDIAGEEGGGRVESILTAEMVKALVGKVDSALIPTAIHADKGFEALVQEVDP